MNPTLTPEEVAILTDRLVEISIEIEALIKEKKDIQAKLEPFALDQPHETLKDDKREGRRVTISGTRHRLPIVFTSDLLIKSFKEGSPKHKELIAILADRQEPADLTADQQLKLFFDAPNTWEARYDDGQRFRKAVAEHLPEEIAAVFISACTQRDKHGVKKNNTVFDLKSVTKVEEVRE